MYGIETILKLNETVTASGTSRTETTGRIDTTTPESHSGNARVIEVTSRSWKTDVFDSQLLPVVVDFYAD